MTEADAYNELQAYTLGHGNVAFIHQHVVDAWGAQHAQPGDKPVRIFFSLAGLLLKIERGFTGRQVQNAHRELARQKRMSAPIVFADSKGALTVIDVMSHPPGPERDRAIDEWCASVWSAWSRNRGVIQAALVEARRCFSNTAVRNSPTATPSCQNHEGHETSGANASPFLSI